MRALLRTLLLAAAFALGTATFGWWAVPLLAAAWGLIARQGGGAAPAAAAGAFTAWLALLLWSAARGPVAARAAKLGALLGVPRIGLFALTLAFPAALAWAAAYVAAELGRGLARAAEGRR